MIERKRGKQTEGGTTKKRNLPEHEELMNLHENIEMDVVYRWTKSLFLTRLDINLNIHFIYILFYIYSKKWIFQRQKCT